MNRGAVVARGAVGVLATVSLALAGASWHAVAGVVLAVLIVVTAGCWVIADSSRVRRLATLIRAWRGTVTLSAARARPASPRRRGQQYAARKK